MSLTNTDDVTSLQQMCSDGVLKHTCEVVTQDNVVMDPEGHISYSNGNEAVAELRKKRKELVLGLNGFDQHTLNEANEIISSERDSTMCLIRDALNSRKV